MKEFKMLSTDEKLELERLFKEYADPGSLYTNGDEDERKWVELVERWVEFRLSVSGGAESSMGRIGCGTVDGFLNEIDWFDDMGCDWGGAYRGDFSYENRDGLFELLDNSSLSKETIELIKETHNERHFSDDDE